MVGGRIGGRFDIAVLAKVLFEEAAHVRDLGVG